MAEDGLEIVRLGAQGDGVADAADSARFIAGALPGERWVLDRGSFQLVGPPSAERRTPPCQHFGTCGGCAAQHMSDALYRDWKTQIVAAAFAHRGLEITPEPLVGVPLRSRRRAVLTARRQGGQVALGLHARGSPQVVALATCPVLLPAIEVALPGLAEIAGRLLGDAEEARMVVIATDAGLDVAISVPGCSKPQTGPGQLRPLAALAERHGILRLTRDGEPILLRATPRLRIGGAEVAPPPAAFLQAVAEAEAALSAVVVEGLGRAKRVADIFAGLGTFTFSIAKRARVDAFDSDGAAITALEAGARGAQGIKPIQARVRDLVHEPLSRTELRAYDGVVVDPPRAGATAQAQVLATSEVARIVMVSCNPATLARDVRQLVDGGYVLERVVPVDQFVFSAEVEVAAVLGRQTSRPRSART